MSTTTRSAPGAHAARKSAVFRASAATSSPGSRFVTQSESLAHGEPCRAIFAFGAYVRVIWTKHRPSPSIVFARLPQSVGFALATAAGRVEGDPLDAAR